MKFSKYQCCGNDFIIVEKHINDVNTIRKLCDRHRGIGADGLIFIENQLDGSFKIFFYNSDGSTDTFCGNGSLCSVDYAVKNLNIRKDFFTASDGKHYFKKKNDGLYEISLHDMAAPTTIELSDADKKMVAEQNLQKGYFCNTGSPHFVLFVDDVKKIYTSVLGKYFRHNINTENGGCNVDFVSITKPGVLKIRTFERGVEIKTWGCGTGSVAAAITYAQIVEKNTNQVILHNIGGKHIVSFNRYNEMYSYIRLQGTPKCVFKGEIDIL